MSRPPSQPDGPTREERVEWGDRVLEILLPRSSDDLIDVSGFNDDERLPYWAELWPSARALADHLRAARRVPGRGLELGCGVGLPSLALKTMGWRVVATDYYAEALEFVRINAARNGLEPPECLHLDWRNPPVLEPFPLVVAADVLYEQRNVGSLAEVLHALTAPGGEVLLADPGRTYLPTFVDRMRAAEWNPTLLECREMPPVTDSARPSVIQIWHFIRPLTDPSL